MTALLFGKCFSLTGGGVYKKFISGDDYGINENMNGKKWFAALLLLCLMMSGCSQVRERLENALMESSGVLEDGDYLQYQALEASDQLDEAGVFISEEVERQRQAEVEMPSGTVRVTFARNDYLKITYFRDEALTDPLPAENCWLEPGDAVYASEPVLLNPNSSLYDFSQFLVREYDEAGKMKRVLAEPRDVPGLVFRIPENFSGTEISIIPLGGYRSRTVTLSAVYGSGEQEQILENGVWQINGRRYGNGTVALNPMESYRVVYDYSAYKEGWYFAGSTPESYWDRTSDGTITFLAVPTNEEHVDYTVRLHPYGSMTVGNAVNFQNAVDSLIDSASAIFGNKNVIGMQNIVELIQVNGISVGNNFSDTEINVPELKVGDEILIRVPADLKVIADGMALPAPELKNESREYRFSIPDREDMNFRLSVSRRNSETEGQWHVPSVARGTMALYDALGNRYAEGSELPAEDEKVTVEIRPDSGLCIYGKNVKDNVYRAEMSFASFVEKFDTIVSEHPIRPGIMVYIDTADELGECTFWSGNEQIFGQVMLREGQDLQFDYILRQDAGYEIILAPEDRGEAISLWSPLAANRQLDVTDALSGMTLRCRDFLTFKEGTTDVIEDPF